MKQLLYLVEILLLGTGCTASLQNAARGNVAPVPPEELRLEVVSARLVQVFNPDGGWFKTINICVKRTRLPGTTSYHTVDLLYPQYSRPPVSFDDRDGVFVYRASSLDLKSGCELDKLYHRSLRPVLLKELPVIQVSEERSVKFSNQHDEAVYVAYENETVKAVGYVSARPFFTSRHNFNVDLMRTGLYSEYVQQKPYLLLLTPLTAIADVTTGAIFLGAMGVSCNSQPNGCR